MFRTFLIQIIFALALIINYWADSEEPGNLKMKLSDTSSNFVNGLPEGVTLNGYLDGYYNYNNDFNSALSKFSLLSPYRDEFRVNIAMLKLAYASDIVRGTLTVQYGDIPGVGWPSNMQYLQEANIGFRPFKNFWVDMGYFLTHIGAEGVKPKDNFFSTYSLCAFNEPTYQSGIRLSYNLEKLTVQLHLLNGYNVLADNNKNKSVGITLDYNPFSNIELVYNNIIGNEMPVSSGIYIPKTRFYNNFIVKLFPSKRTDVLLCFDFCSQEKSKLKDPGSAALMYSGFVAFRYRLGKKISAMLRAETFNDPDAILSNAFTDGNGDLTGLKANGISFGVEYDPMQRLYIRLESRFLETSKGQNIFNNNRNSRLESVFSTGIEF